jgi:transposase-like protein
VLVSEKRDLVATRQFFTHALQHGPSPIEVTTDRAAAYPRVLDELVPAACHVDRCHLVPFHAVATPLASS